MRRLYCLTKDKIMGQVLSFVNQIDWKMWKHKNHQAHLTVWCASWLHAIASQHGAVFRVDILGLDSLALESHVHPLADMACLSDAHFSDKKPSEDSSLTDGQPTSVWKGSGLRYQLQKVKIKFRCLCLGFQLSEMLHSLIYFCITINMAFMSLLERTKVPYYVPSGS